ncbi:MAG: hypothetical protein M5U20_01965 [Phycisphaerales bacterium]|nr:hypothetical protein [Phycisphaerales bacterium]
MRASRLGGVVEAEDAEALAALGTGHGDGSIEGPDQAGRAGAGREREREQVGERGVAPGLGGRAGAGDPEQSAAAVRDVVAEVLELFSAEVVGAQVAEDDGVELGPVLRGTWHAREGDVAFLDGTPARGEERGGGADGFLAHEQVLDVAVLPARVAVEVNDAERAVVEFEREAPGVVRIGEVRHVRDDADAPACFARCLGAGEEDNFGRRPLGDLDAALVEGAACAFVDEAHDGGRSVAAAHLLNGHGDGHRVADERGGRRIRRGDREVARRRRTAERNGVDADALGPQAAEQGAVRLVG